jgi:hypothetical protein
VKRRLLALVATGFFACRARAPEPSVTDRHAQVVSVSSIDAASEPLVDPAVLIANTSAGEPRGTGGKHLWGAEPGPRKEGPLLLRPDRAGGVFAPRGFDSTRVASRFVERYDARGDVLWSIVFGECQCPKPDPEACAPCFVSDAAVGPRGALVLAGWAGEAGIDFGRGVIPSLGGDDSFVGALDAHAHYAWSKRLDPAHAAHVHALAVDDDDSVVLLASFDGTANGGVLLRLDASGASRTSKKLDGWPAPHALRARAGRVAYLVEKAPHDKGVLELHVEDTRGASLWESTLEGAYRDVPPVLELDAAGNVVLATSFDGKHLDFGFGKLGAEDEAGTVVVKLRADGQPLWVRRFGGQRDPACKGTATPDCIPPSLEAMALAPDGSVVLAGFVDGPLPIGGGFPSGANNESWVMELDPDGFQQWSRRSALPGDCEIAITTGGMSVAATDAEVFDSVWCPATRIGTTFNSPGARASSIAAAYLEAWSRR